jgi:hypothetical protein
MWCAVGYIGVFAIADVVVLWKCWAWRRELREDQERFQGESKANMGVRGRDWRYTILWLVEWWIGGRLEGLGHPVPFI